MKFPSCVSPKAQLVSVSSTSSTSQENSNSTIQSNLSLQTLPSVPSLQKLSPHSPHLSLTHHSLSSPQPFPSCHVNFLFLHNSLLYASSGNFIKIYDTNSPTPTLIDTLIATNGAVKSVTFTNGLIITGHQDRQIRIYKRTQKNKHKLITTLPTFQDRLRRSLLPSNYVNVRRHKKKLWIQHNDVVSGLATVSSNLMCSVSWDKHLKIWNTSDLKCLESIKAHDDAINAVTVSPDGVIFTGSTDHKIKTWALRGKKYSLVATLEKHKSGVNALALNDDGSVLFSGACDRSILVWEREESANYMVVSGALRGHGKAILCLINVSDLLLSGSADRTVRIWRAGVDGRFCCLTVLDGHLTPVRSLAVVEGGGGDGEVTVFSGSFDGEIKMWQVLVSSKN